MPWPPENNSKPKPDAGKQQKPPSSFNLSTSPPSAPRGWDSCLSITEWSDWVDPRTLIPTAVLTTSILLIFRINRRLRRFPDAVSISPPYFRGRSLFGQVTSVGDGDNFRFFHTPGGRLAGWGWLPWKKVPTSKKDLKDNTIHIRLAGIDAPELPHFGRPEQPFAREAHEWLTSYLMNRRVRAYVHRQDQYQRAVGSVYVRRAFDFPMPFRKRDVSYEMLRRGLATVYEAKSGAEFGGEEREQKYRKAEWWAKLRGAGLWKGYEKIGKDWESPRDYKNRMGLGDLQEKK